jgi:hypothetical protein
MENEGRWRAVYGGNPSRKPISKTNTKTKFQVKYNGHLSADNGPRTTDNGQRAMGYRPLSK